MADYWPTKPLSVAGLQLDLKNPRLGRESGTRAPREIIQYLFDYDKALEIADSISSNGFFSNEPLLAIHEDGKIVVVEGNRRLAALKALKEPGLVTGTNSKKLERMAKRIHDPQSIAKVPVTIAPSRRATDQLIARRHVGTAVLAWEKENQASFILEKLEEGYTNDQLRDQLGFAMGDIQKARQTRAIADMARSLELPVEIQAKLDGPRAGLFSTIGRVFDSTVGRDYLMVEFDQDHGLKGKTTKSEFIKGFSKLVKDVVLGHVSSRKLNTSDDIKKYFEGLDAADRVQERKGGFVPADIVKGKSVASKPVVVTEPKVVVRKLNACVLPRNFHNRYGSDRLSSLRTELVKLKRRDYTNTGAVMLRVFFELTVIDYLNRSKRMDGIIAELKAKNKIGPGGAKLGQMLPKVIEIAKKQLKSHESQMVEKALKFDLSAPFSLSDLHAFVHQPDEFPTERDSEQFWRRVEPLFRLMLEQEPKGD